MIEYLLGLLALPIIIGGICYIFHKIYINFFDE